MGEETIKQIFVERLNYYMKALGRTRNEVADAIGVTYGSVRDWSQGVTIPRMDKIEKLAEYFGCSKGNLLLENEKPSAQDISTCKISVFGYVAAGAPITAAQNIVGYEQIDTSSLPMGEYFGLRVRGESMLPKIDDGDTVIVRRQSTVENNDIAVVLIGDEATIKRVRVDTNGMWLMPSNPTYQATFVPDTEDATILGKVVELRSRF